MKLYYDGCVIKEFDELYSKGLIQGVTTNLSFSKEQMIIHKKSYDSILKKMYTKVKNKKLSFSTQVSDTNPNIIKNEAIKLNKTFKNGVDLKIKIPINYLNCEVIKNLIEKKIKINATCVTGFLQGVAAANLGCTYISFFWGKMCDEGIDPIRIVSDFRNFLDKNNLSKTSKILVGSIRQTSIIKDAITSGADIVTLRYDNFKKILNQVKSSEADQLFQIDWKK